MVDFAKTACLIVSGAGRGYGRSLCTVLAGHLKAGSTLVLLGRSKETLEETKSLVLAQNSSLNVFVCERFDCGAFCADLLVTFLDELVPKLSSTGSLLIIHNAGTVGDPSQMSLEYSLDTASEYFVVNFSSMVAVNNVILRILCFFDCKTVVNISSLLAIVPGKSLGLYSAGKAARDMFFKVVAAENPSLRVLNYAPGPMDTDMLKTIIEKTHDDELKTTFQGMTPVKMEDSVTRLIDLLKANKFESGAHIDVYDPLPE